MQYNIAKESQGDNIMTKLNNQRHFVDIRRTVQELEQQHRTGESFSPRPHMRRAHYHHFWTGPHDGERKLIVRWLPPIPVNWKDDTELPTVIHLVTSKKDV